MHLFIQGITCLKLFNPLQLWLLSACCAC